MTSILRLSTTAIEALQVQEYAEILECSSPDGSRLRAVVLKGTREFGATLYFPAYFYELENYLVEKALLGLRVFIARNYSSLVYCLIDVSDEFGETVIEPWVLNWRIIHASMGAHAPCVVHNEDILWVIVPLSEVEVVNMGRSL